MKIYILIWNDRHSDATAHPYTDPQIAIENAKRIAKKYTREPDDYQERDYGKNSGWLFYAEYSCEGDHVRVVTTELDKNIETS